MKDNEYSAEKALPISVIVIAIVSIIIGIRQAVERRKHNRLSVRPRLDLNFSKNHDDKM